MEKREKRRIGREKNGWAGRKGEVGDVRDDGRERRGRKREEIGGGEKDVGKGEEDRAEKGR